MPVLFSAPTLIITDLKKAFAVFGLMPIRPAICFVLRSWSRRSTVSLSRLLSRNFRATLSRFSAPRGFLSSKRAAVGPRRNSEIRFHRERPKLVAPLSRRDFIQKFRRRETVMMAVAGKQGPAPAQYKFAEAFVLRWNFRISEDRQGLFTCVDWPEGSVQKEKRRG